MARPTPRPLALGVWDSGRASRASCNTSICWWAGLCPFGSSCRNHSTKFFALAWPGAATATVASLRLANLRGGGWPQRLDLLSASHHFCRRASDKSFPASAIQSFLVLDQRARARIWFVTRCPGVRSRPLGCSSNSACKKGLSDSSRGALSATPKRCTSGQRNRSLSAVVRGPCPKAGMKRNLRRGPKCAKPQPQTSLRGRG